MKHFSLKDIFSKIATTTPIGEFYFLQNFHLGLCGAIKKYVKNPLFLLYDDSDFDVIIKNFSNSFDVDTAVIIPPLSHDDATPPGFISDKSIHHKRSCEIISSYPDSISFIVCAASSFDIPLFTNQKIGLDVFTCTGFDDCLGYLKNNSYSSVDIVTSPGEYAIRGGIIDFFSLSAPQPVRISFLAEEVSVYSFDINTQTTTSKIHSLIISPKKQVSKLALSEFDLSRFSCFILTNNHNIKNIKILNIDLFNKLKYFSYNQFIHKKNKNYNILSDDCLSSTAIVYNDEDCFVPLWFQNKKSRSRVELQINNKPIFNIKDIAVGDYLVHRDFGVGVYSGIITNENAVGIQELIVIRYNEGGVLRVDTKNLDLVDFFASHGSENISLDSLNKTATWKRKLSAAKKNAEETVGYLLNLYIKRNKLIREPFIETKKMEKELLNDFPFKDTPDQAIAWNEISNDLKSQNPMDRLLCGDVGFGKTEIAIRAAFRCVLNNKRVVVLAPTTILVGQLFSSFCSRLNKYGVSVEMVSRLKTTKEIKVIKNKSSNNKIDVLIGTHTLLNHHAYIEGLGLLIVDEEHRFGVSHKEKIKNIKSSTDVLSMSATPIPRSLNLAFTGIYSISLLQTPPLMRYPIITRVGFFDKNTIIKAIEYEVERGGQVFFVHNDVKNIEKMTLILAEWLPSINIKYIHGQESPRQIENTMQEFISSEFSVLVCSSIIEAGIDVPRANSIIINNANLFGLSQLYQMRGRVGRGDQQAYAYLLFPERSRLSDKAFRRIKTIEQNTKLGSGYNISRTDMEIRGSGSLFGYKQSGGSSSVGYDMYLRLIQKNLQKSGHIKNKSSLLSEDVSVDIYQNASIPTNYIASEQLRFSFYKALVSANSTTDIDSILFSMENRFGAFPESVLFFSNQCKLKLSCAQNGIISIITKGCGTVVLFALNFYSEDMFLSLYDYTKSFFKDANIEYHFLPNTNSLSFCIHIANQKDIFSILNRFLDKFNHSQ